MRVAESFLSPPGFVRDKRSPPLPAPSEFSGMFTILPSFLLTTESARRMTSHVRRVGKIKIRKGRSGERKVISPGKGDATSGSGSYRRCCAPCDAAWQWPAIHFGQRRGAHGLPRFAASGRARARVVSGGLLPDVEPRASGGDPAPSRGPGRDVEAGAWALRVILERFPRLLRTCVAGAILY